ncbi:MAG: HAD family hydrolase [Hyphomicrobiales bacterium]
MTHAKPGAAEALFVCTDLDRTLLPNGAQPESPEARPMFRRLAALPDVHLAYVSGRDRGLVEAAIAEYDLPVPDFVVGDVGTTIYRVTGGGWQPLEAWWQRIGTGWEGAEGLPGARPPAIESLFSDIDGIRLQEPAKQGRYKLSYYAADDLEPAVLERMRRRLAEARLPAELVWSIDETTDTGLIDILPAAATKLGAVEFLIETAGYRRDRTLFAGDSGNDLPVLASAIPSVLVANATAGVRDEARRLAMAAGTEAALYLARGSFAGMNGNYAAGILEGVARYHPRIAERLAD